MVSVPIAIGMNPDGVTKLARGRLFFVVPYTVYILHSAALDRFYVGYTAGPVEIRLQKHLAKHKGFTGKATDWQLKHVELYDSKKEAIDRESQIKSWKSKKKISELISIK